MTELIVAAVISAFAIGAASYGLMVMMESNFRHEERSQRRMDLTRAIDYLSEDIRMANQIEEVPVGSTLPTGATGVFMLTIPDDNPDPAANNPEIPDDPGTGNDLNSYQIVYFVKPSTATWLPPNTVHRAIGDYSGGVNIATATDPGVNELVDAIREPTSLPACDSVPPDPEGAGGFYACIVDADTVEVYLSGNICDPADSFCNYCDPADPTEGEACEAARTFDADTTVFARSRGGASPSPSPSPSPTPVP